MPFIWIGFAVIMAVCEAFTSQLVSIWFVLGGVSAAITSIFTKSISIQSAVFLVVSLLALLVTRPIVNKIKMKKGFESTNADRFIGERAVVIEDIDQVSGSGKIKALGQVWSAKHEADSKIECGEKVIINKIEGVKVVVSKE